MEFKVRSKDMSFKIFVINPGSTSTKLSLFEDRKEVYSTAVVHDAQELLSFPHINDQLGYRMNVIKEFLKKNNIDLSDVDAIVGRGGSVHPVPSGVFEVDRELLEDTRNIVGGMIHPSCLGVQLGRELQKEYGGRLFMVDPICVDEYIPEARFTGIRGVRRKSIGHALNLKGTLHHHCELLGIEYEENNFIACHIDGGISVTAHRKGQMIDGSNACGGDGAFTPTRIGSIAVTDLLDYLEAGHSIADTRLLCAGKGGFVNHFGSNDGDELKAKILAGDEYANLIWQSFIYNIAKQIGAMSTVLKGDVHSIVLTGRYVRFGDIIEKLTEATEWIAPVHVYQGELEHQAMANGAYKVLTGKITPLDYHTEVVRLREAHRFYE